MTFEALNVNTNIVSALRDMEITIPTLIQEKAIPLIKAGKDVIGMSNTGSGKTAAFGIPILEKIQRGQGIQAVILAPTRELAVQISREMQKFGKGVKCSITTVYGGVAINPQIKSLERADIVVGTPGRMCDHLQRGTINLTRVNMFVLDEADKMVEMGFIEDVERIMEYTPKSRQVMLFGATLSQEISHIKQRFMKNPEVAKAESNVTTDFLKQFYYNVDSNDKFSLLVHLLNKEDRKKSIVFCSTRATVEILAKNLRKNGINAEMMHGKLTQSRRLKIIENFSKANADILVASAVAARGIDIKDVSHIFNYDLSRDPQEYIHRVGRTARAGESGKSITLLCHRDYEAFGEINRRFDVKIDELPKENFKRLQFDTKRIDNGGRFGGRRNFGGRGGPRGGSGFRNGGRDSPRGRSNGNGGGNGGRRFGQGQRNDSRGRSGFQSGSGSNQSQESGSGRSHFHGMD